MPNECISELSASVISVKMLKSAIEKTQDVYKGAYNKPISNHRGNSNPYESLYPDDYEESLAAVSAMKPFMCIKDLVVYFISESQHVMFGTVPDKDWYFYHDTLSLMTATSTMKLMTETMIDGVSVKDRWLVPQNEVNAGTVYGG